jgi:hypothetical protein
VSAGGWAAFAVFCLLAVPVCLWVIAVAWAMIADVAGSVFSALQASVWFVWKELRGDHDRDK